MKKIVSLFAAALMLFSLAACGKTASSPNTPAQGASAPATSAGTQTSSGKTGGNILIAYFSRADENYNVGYIEKGNTQIVAEMIADETGGELFQIARAEPYPTSYDECTSVASQEQSDNARPALKEDIDVSGYDVIYLGYPIWWGDMPMAVYTFLEGHDFTGKTIIPFCTHEGSGVSGTDSHIAAACPGASVLTPLSLRGSVAQNSQDEAKTAVLGWLRETDAAE